MIIRCIAFEADLRNDVSDFCFCELNTYGTDAYAVLVITSSQLRTIKTLKFITDDARSDRHDLLTPVARQFDQKFTYLVHGVVQVPQEALLLEHLLF